MGNLPVLEKREILDQVLDSFVKRFDYIAEFDSDGMEYRHLTVAFQNFLNIYENETQTVDSDEFYFTGDIPALWLTYDLYGGKGGGSTEYGSFNEPEKAYTELERAGGWWTDTYSKTGPKRLGIIPSLHPTEHWVHADRVIQQNNNTSVYADYPERLLVIVPVRNTTDADITIPASSFGSTGSSRSTVHAHADIMFFTPNEPNSRRDDVLTVSYQQLSKNTGYTTKGALTNNSDIVIPADTTCVIAFRNSVSHIQTWNTVYQYSAYQIIDNISNVVDGTNVVVDRGMLQAFMSQQMTSVTDLWTTSTVNGLKRI